MYFKRTGMSSTKSKILVGFAYHRAYPGICSVFNVPCWYLTDKIVEFGAYSVCK